MRRPMAAKVSSVTGGVGDIFAIGLAMSPYVLSNDSLDKIRRIDIALTKEAVHSHLGLKVCNVQAVIRDGRYRLLVADHAQRVS